MPSIVTKPRTSTRLKTERPDIYVTYAKFGGSWQLRVVAAGDED